MSKRVPRLVLGPEKAAVDRSDASVQASAAPADGAADAPPAPESGLPDAAPIPGTSRERWALAVFVGYLAVCSIVIVFHFGDHLWFQGDEMGFLVDRGLADPGDLLRPQNSHWSTVPIVVYQVLYSVFGLHTYTPYLVGVVAAHLALVCLLRVTMRRAGVDPWIATVAAGSFVLFGSGAENILFGVQISMVGSLVFGLGHLLLADHDGPLDRRDAAGLLCGLGGLMSSGIGPALTVTVGLAVLVRRGWRMALVHTAPLAAVYLLWYATFRDEIATQGPTPALPGPLDVIDWLSTGVTGVFVAFAGTAVVGAVLAAMVLGGTYLAWRPLPRLELRRVAAAPAALAIGALVLFLTISLQRYSAGVGFARSSRYLAMGLALALPLMAVAADGWVRWKRPLFPVVLALFVIGGPHNLAAFDDATQPPAFYASTRELLLAAAYSPEADEVAGAVVPDPGWLNNPRVTMAFLRAARDDGRLPSAPTVGTELERTLYYRLGLWQHAGPVPPELVCDIYAEPTQLRPDDGDLLAITHAVLIAADGAPGDGRPQRFDPAAGNLILVGRPDMTLRIESAVPDELYWVCA